jgi:2,3-dimethylmalate lyase
MYSLPKRCGHLGGGKELISPAEMAGKLRAACAARRSREMLIVGRTDARGPLGFDEAVRRARTGRTRGADGLIC